MIKTKEKTRTFTNSKTDHSRRERMGYTPEKS